ncbi:hypothetical protein B0H16DRAFT_1564865 [Mycena metata]|uniref:Uncharacterized protein n=1 Tax=Mycena metata TaxID=1033252 RepID=A0AAD7IF31_9AGAR|nr:hypothetical protein B0H16DRAFT_1564865 [Mycena metata]
MILFSFDPRLSPQRSNHVLARTTGCITDCTAVPPVPFCGGRDTSVYSMVFCLCSRISRSISSRFRSLVKILSRARVICGGSTTPVPKPASTVDDAAPCGASSTARTVSPSESSPSTSIATALPPVPADAPVPVPIPKDPSALGSLSRPNLTTRAAAAAAPSLSLSLSSPAPARLRKSGTDARRNGLRPVSASSHASCSRTLGKRTVGCCCCCAPAPPPGVPGVDVRRRPTSCARDVAAA